MQCLDIYYHQQRSYTQQPSKTGIQQNAVRPGSHKFLIQSLFEKYQIHWILEGPFTSWVTCRLVGNDCPDIHRNKCPQTRTKKRSSCPTERQLPVQTHTKRCQHQQPATRQQSIGPVQEIPGHILPPATKLHTTAKQDNHPANAFRPGSHKFLIQSLFEKYQIHWILRGPYQWGDL